MGEEEADASMIDSSLKREDGGDKGGESDEAKRQRLHTDLEKEQKEKEEKAKEAAESAEQGAKQEEQPTPAAAASEAPPAAEAQPAQPAAPPDVQSPAEGTSHYSEEPRAPIAKGALNAHKISKLQESVTGVNVALNDISKRIGANEIVIRSSRDMSFEEFHKGLYNLKSAMQRDENRVSRA